MRSIKKSFIILILLLAISCKKDEQPDIPYVYVYEILYPNTMDYISISNYKYVNAGYRGLIVYRMSESEFRVYERCCPHDPEVPDARVFVESSIISAVDTICNSHFSLIDGSPYQGPSRFSLMTYKYSYDGDRLLIFN